MDSAGSVVLWGVWCCCLSSIKGNEGLFPTSRPFPEILLSALQVLDGYWVGLEGEWEDGRQAGGWVVGGKFGKGYGGGEGVSRSIFEMTLWVETTYSNMTKFA